MPNSDISKQYEDLSFRPLIDPIVSRVMGLIKRSGRNLSFDSQQLYDLLKQRYLKN